MQRTGTRLYQNSALTRPSPAAAVRTRQDRQVNTIVENALGRIVKHSEEAPVASEIRVRLARGRLKARVTESG